MTLNVSVITPQFIVQASDRRMVELPSRKRIDRANKGVVIRTPDGVFAISFSGIGAFPAKRVDLWLAEVLAAEGGPEMPIGDCLELIAAQAKRPFSRLPSGIDRRHSFVVAGWLTDKVPPKPALWAVLNYSNSASGPTPARDQFEILQEDVARRGLRFYAFGLIQGIVRADRRRFEAAVRRDAGLDSVEEAVASVIRSAACKPSFEDAISEDSIAVALTPRGEIGARYHSFEGAVEWSYAPLLVWNDGGRNWIAGDAKLKPSPSTGYLFGERMLVLANAPYRDAKSPDIEEVDFRFRFSRAKFHHQSQDATAHTKIVRHVQLTRSTKEGQRTNREVTQP